MRFPLDTTLFDRQSPEDTELQVSWNVTVWVTVRTTGESWQQPAEQLVEDMQIEDVSATFLTYGLHGQVYCPLDKRSPIEVREYERTLAWLQSQLDERDHWRERIETQARQLALSQQASANYVTCPV